MVPTINVLSNILHYGHAGTVEAVMVDGRWLMRDRHVLTLDEDDVARRAVEATRGAWKRLHATSPGLPMPPGVAALWGVNPR